MLKLNKVTTHWSRPCRVPALVLRGLVLAESLSAQPPYSDRPIDLSGQWRFALDPTDSGVNQQWFSRDLPYRLIKLPGVLQSQNYGEEISTNTPWVLSLYDRYWYLREDYKQYTTKNVKVPFLSQPPRHYLGAAWYQRDLEIPSYWVTRRVVLTLERPHWEGSGKYGGQLSRTRGDFRPGPDATAKSSGARRGHSRVHGPGER